MAPLPCLAAIYFVPEPPAGNPGWPVGTANLHRAPGLVSKQYY